MRFGWVFGAALVALVASEASASIVFSSTLEAESERPGPVDSPGVGSATAMLSGDAGAYVLSYTLNYTGLTSPPVEASLHYSIEPLGRDPAEQTGPVVFALHSEAGPLGTEGTLSGQWRFDDTEFPLTNALADSLVDGELYFNLHTAANGDGEIRGQLRALGGGSDAGGGTGAAAPPAATPIPLPPALVMGLAGLAAAGYAARRPKAITR